MQTKRTAAINAKKHFLSPEQDTIISGIENKIRSKEKEIAAIKGQLLNAPRQMQVFHGTTIELIEDIIAKQKSLLDAYEKEYNKLRGLNTISVAEKSASASAPAAPKSWFNRMLGRGRRRCKTVRRVRRSKKTVRKHSRR